MAGYLYILQCNDGTYYTGSTINISRRLSEHQSGNGANYTKKKSPVSLVYIEEFYNVRDAFYREKQIQRWGHGKKEFLIEKNLEKLKELAECKNLTHYLLKKEDPS